MVIYKDRIRPRSFEIEIQLIDEPWKPSSHHNSRLGAIFKMLPRHLRLGSGVIPTF